jgi:hypothetical protein
MSSLRGPRLGAFEGRRSRTSPFDIDARKYLEDKAKRVGNRRYDGRVVVRTSFVGLLAAVLSSCHATGSTLPPPNRNLYAGVSASDWKNPYLVVEKTGVRVTALGRETTVPVSAVEATLRALPADAWPYGAVVGMDAGAMFASHGSDDAPIAMNWDALSEVLRRLGIDVEVVGSRPPPVGAGVSAGQLGPLALPKPDPKRYAAVRDASAWKNPYLVVESKGVRVIALGVDAVVSVLALEGTLRALPGAAWPYGGVVAAQEQSIRAGDGTDDAAIAVNKQELVNLAKRLGLTIEWWPSG